MTKRPFLFVLVFIPLFAMTTFAQETGRIAGRVAREDGTGVGSVTVVINEISMADITDQGGSFAFDNVPVGTYSITFILGENSDSESGIEVTVGMTATVEKTVDWEMGFVETMTVTSASLHTERIVEAPAAITVISKEQIARKAAYGQIPKLVEFTPGVNVTQSGLYDYNVNTRGFNSLLKPAGGHPHPFSYSWFDFQPQADIPPGFEPLLAPNTLENTFRAGLGYITDRWDADFAVRWVDDFRWSVRVFQGDVESYTSLDLNANFRVVEHWKIFLTTAYDGGKRISVLCFRRSDGELLWEVFAPKATPESPHRRNGHASGTPTTDGVRVYAYLGNHGLVAVDLSGKMAWHRPFAAIPAFHGTAGSPLLYKNSVILYQDHEGGTSFVAAFDKSTGKVKWSTHRDETVSWGTPIVIATGDRDELIVSSQKRVYAYNPDTGKELWTCGGNLYEVIPTPVVGHGLVYCSSGRAGPTLAIRPGGSGNVTDTHVVWKSPKGSPFVPSPLLCGDYLYMVNDIQSVATCYDAKSGGVMWQGRLGEAQREGFSASPIGVQGKVFFTNDLGDTFVLKAGPEFELLHVNRLKQRTLASPALVDGHWYFRTERHFLSIGS